MRSIYAKRSIGGGGGSRGGIVLVRGGTEGSDSELGMKHEQWVAMSG